MATGAVIARILTQYSDKGSKAAQKDIARLTKKFDDFGKKAKKSFGIAIAATATLAIKIGKDAVEAAIEDSKSQAQLALAMRNTTGATKEAIAAAETYIEKTMFRTNTADDQLRTSLAQLYIATGDLTKAQKLQGIALDVAASQGKDLSAVTIAMTKAQQGNLTALKRLSPELSGLITKGMKAEEAFALLGLTYYGSAEALANLDPLTNLKLQYGEILETLGYELLPVIKEFAKILESDVIPVIKEWIEANGDKLRQGLADIINLSMGFLSALMEVAGFIQRNKFWINLALQLFILGRAFKIAGRAMSLIDKVMGSVIGVFKGGKNAVKGLRDQVKKLSDKFSDFIKTTEDGYFGRFVELLGKAVSYASQLVTGFLGLGAAWIAGKNALKSILGLEEDRAKLIGETTKKTYNQMRADQIAAAAEKERARLRALAEKAAAAAAAKAAEKAAKQAKIEEALEERTNALKKKLNITKLSALDEGTETLIQRAAAENLLKKQGAIAKEEIDKLKRIKEENFLLDAKNVLAKRYQDIQKAIADQKLDTKEIEDLSKKWGISKEAVVAYIHIVKSVEDQVISSDEIQVLADLFGTSTQNAHKFLETYMRIQDGLLDSQEVFQLIKLGFFESEREARIYADLVATVHDGIAKDEDFEKLRIKWDLSKKEVNAYVLAMGADFDYKGTFLDPVVQLAIKWDLATAALDKFLKLLNGGKDINYDKFAPPSIIPAVPGPGPGPGPGPNPAAAAAVAATTKIQEEIATLTELRKTTDPGTGINFLLKEHIDALQHNSKVYSSGVDEQSKLRAMGFFDTTQATIADFRKAEEASMANFEAAIAKSNYDEQFRFANRGTVANAGPSLGAGDFRMREAGINVTVNVAGSVTSEQDLVQTVRNGLLAAQYNGDSITLQAI
jgi:hypothetical protein